MRLSAEFTCPGLLTELPRNQDSGFQNHAKNKIMFFIYVLPSIAILQSNIFMLL